MPQLLLAHGCALPPSLVARREHCAAPPEQSVLCGAPAGSARRPVQLALPHHHPAEVPDQHLSALQSTREQCIAGSPADVKHSHAHQDGT
jgi:hypothetical protein